MFGDLSGMMGKLKETQQKIEETKARLNNVFIEGEAFRGKIKVTVTANRTVKNIEISEEISDKEALEDYLVIALNEALQKAEKISETELAAVAKSGIPSIPGIDLFGKG